MTSARIGWITFVARFAALFLSVAAATMGCGDDGGSSNGTDTATVADVEGDLATADTYVDTINTINKTIDDTAGSDATLDAVDTQLADTTPGDGVDGTDATASCGRSPQAADRPRKVVVSQPFSSTPGVNGTGYEVLDLAVDGTLSRPGVHFDMLAATFGTIAFTPNGRVGISVQKNGSLGVFRLDDAGPVVVHEGFDNGGEFYASKVLVHPSGEVAWVLDGNFQEHGGGIYRVDIACDGTLTSAGLVAASKLAGSGEWLDDDTLLVAAREMMTSVMGDDAHIVDITNPTSPAYVAGVDVFGDDDVFIAATGLTHDKRFFLIADNNSFTGAPRVGVAEVGAGTLSAVQVLTGYTDPAGIVTSPWNNAAVVTDFQPPGQGIYVLAYDPAATPPFSDAGKVAYVNGNPQLPGAMVMVERGSLEGRVLVVENTSVRQLQFAPDGSVADVGLLNFGSGAESIPGAIGVQP